MARVIALLLVLFPYIVTSPSALAQTMSDSDTAAQVAVELSALEASDDLNTLYDRIHPDARAEVPRAAAVGWFQNEFAPRGPGISTVTGVRFVSWTWAVTGVTYPDTAEVSFVQPFADGTVTEDVVRLVQDYNGEWRWFFGRSREFVDEQIARYVPAAPVATQRQSIYSAFAYDIDAYWAITFDAANVPYVSPAIVNIDGGGSTGCGYHDQNSGPAFYCPLDLGIYLSLEQLGGINQSFGDFAWVTILAHEWGHHVQFLSGLVRGSGNIYELQADCLSGSYALEADSRDLLADGDVWVGVTVSAVHGDPAWASQDQPGAHGTSDDRVSAFMRGYLDGLVGCRFSPASIGIATQPQTNPTSRSEPSLADLLPTTPQVPSDLTYMGDNQRSLSEVAVNYTNPGETERLFRDWGWGGNVTRSYDGNGASSGVTSVYVSLHSFSSARNAARALEYSLQDQAASTGAWEITVSPIATTTRALATSSDVTIYAQQGNVLVRLTVSPATGQSTAEDIMKVIIAGFP